jgi:CLIP-associating protein 1/2
MVHASNEILQIPDSDAILNLLKTCLRTSNQHLTTATISAIPPLLPLLITISAAHPQTQHALSNSTSSSSVSSTIDAFSLRQVLLAFLPAGGILDRLGDTREKPRDKARESLVILGGYAFRCGGSSSLFSKSRDLKGLETPLAIFDRFLKEAGLSSKVWRVREQASISNKVRRADRGVVFVSLLRQIDFERMY